MAALSKILRSLLHVPEYLVPKPILDLAWKFDGAHGWARERVFQQWCEQQEFRQCFPDMFVFEVSKEPCLTDMVSQSCLWHSFHVQSHGCWINVKKWFGHGVFNDLQHCLVTLGSV